MIGDILTGIVTLIQAAQGADKALGYAIPRVDLYDGEINEANMAALLQVTPAVYVAYAGGRGIEQGSQRKWETTLSVLVVTRNLSTIQAARHGGPKGEVGAIRIAEDLAALLDQKRLGLDIDALEPTAITTLVPGWARSVKAAIVGITLTTGYRVTGAAAASDLADFLRCHVDWDLPPAGATPDYTDDINTRAP